MTKLRVIQPGEEREDPHVAIRAEIAEKKQLLADLKSCHHRPLSVEGCRGCIAWTKALQLPNPFDWLDV